MLTDLITLFTLVLPREHIEPRCADLGQSGATKYRNVYFGLFTHVHCWSKSIESHDLKADVSMVREPIDQWSKEPKVYVSLYPGAR
jgi:hypothetical protein